MTHRVAVLDQELCQPKKCGLECVKYCPVNKSGADCITISDESGKARIDEDICNGCGICVKVCPFDAITIVNLAGELATDRVHQYGPNSFRLYRLPSPGRGEVVGLLGRNGTGKSTVVGVLSGSIRANMGDYRDPPGWDGILEHYKGTEMKAHFEAVRDGSLRSSIKPQQVHMIAGAFDGTGAELLEKYDERGAARQLAAELGLGASLERRLPEMSGGELQRLAIAAAAARDAEMYFFDEPSSYNDVFQRAGVARVIRSLAGAGRSVMVVEHDLVLLDLLSDRVSVLYGEPGAYGIVSGPMSSKAGINAFLDGYLPAENVRFRDKGFTLDASSTAAEFQEGTEVVSYPALSKAYEGFSVRAEPGAVRRGEVLGIMGANALGKTTLMKMLAGAVGPDSGSVDGKIRISYKPQYLQGGPDRDVEEVLGMANGGPVAGTMEEEQVLSPLRIRRLYPKNASTLSGGELQKVAVASCLLQKADVYALDEPSAFLDIEDRIAVARFIQRFARSFGRAAVVIDHDLQLMDLVSDSMVIFTGTPGREGAAGRPAAKSDAMNSFLGSLGMSFRRDERSMRPRVNKEGSRLDKGQKAAGNYYNC
ncbi:MAG: ribosome biogenesis/translation initiation ATPase RLI [Nitrosopumilus sp.]|nr:ribosome biogenesis/translation initiation ATPase RLI [Nitrosopumilus sp.]CAI9830978.1 conserved hypothetical protein [Nitrosopumilaceae archaeon]MDA7942069.1 ribosome biogenesis/translation initiation ATPase RLI [Nitrosopumilus sp.]MDA7943827.1 ribosome biogenesis/translation initiation ATPase RLI [Nitrosopumilus sp.]MDA7944995.1 ribosome biogenesis/translation initiation ATPase RLI [Nitrosopumilus sp.]